jgi:hypothetical protein
MNRTLKSNSYSVNQEKRKERKQTARLIERGDSLSGENKEQVETTTSYEITIEAAETCQIISQMARSFIKTIEWYKTEPAGSKTHDEAVKETFSLYEWRREQIENTPLEEINWGDITAVGEQSMTDALQLWSELKDAATVELESGKRAANVVGRSADAYAMAQFLAIRDSFADEWQPRGGIESAMIDMLVVAFSLQMYWTTIAHQRATETYDKQKKDVERFEAGGWKSPYQSAADAIEQANRLADGYNRQFLRVLRQLRDLRRYSPVVIQNNGGQVNVGNQQVNLKG